MNDSLHQALNEHLALEFGAAHHYLALSIWFELNDLPGFASWMTTQSQDELGHAKRIIAHLLERDLEVTLPAIESPPTRWPSALDAVKSVMASEQQVTRSIDLLHQKAAASNDRAASLMLDWFVAEQVEEENAVRALLGRLRLAGESSLGLLIVDQELAKGTIPGAMEEPTPQ
jgi:ferritin